MSQADLHIHSTVSDGIFTPEEIVRKAAGLGLEIIALADHDSVDGVVPALAAAMAFPGLRVMPNVEISTEYPDGEVHMLGYFIDHTSRKLQDRLRQFRDSRKTRAQTMLSRLAELGMPLEWRRVRELAGEGTIGRPHVAQALLEKNYVTDFKEALDKYLAKGKPAYVERDKFTPAEAVALVLENGGLPVLAHPFTVNNLEPLLARLKELGLVGIEVYYYSHSAEQISTLLGLARKYRLLTGGGTDFHGIGDTRDVVLGSTDLPMAAVEQFISLARQRHLKSALPPIFTG